MKYFRSKKSLLRKLLLSLLVAGFVSGVFHLDDWSKFREVYQHYQEHREDTNMSLASFFYQHFVAPHATASNGHLNKHQQFPFKSAKSLKSHWDQTIVEYHTPFTAAVLAVPVHSIPPSYQLTSEISNSWKPPRQA